MGIRLTKRVLLAKFIFWFIGILLLILLDLNVFPQSVHQRFFKIIFNYNVIIVCIGAIPIVSVSCIIGFLKSPDHKLKVANIMVMILGIFASFMHLSFFVLLTGGV